MAFTSNKRQKTFHISNEWFCGGQLPNEILYPIVDKLDIKSVQSMSLTCKSWNRNVWRYVAHFDTRIEEDNGTISRLSFTVANAILCKLDPLHLSSIYFHAKLSPNQGFPGVLLQCTRVCGLAYINGLSTRSDSMPSDAPPPFNIEKFSRLYSLNLSIPFKGWIAAMTQLTSLSLPSWPISSNQELLKMTNLVHLRIGNEVFPQSLQDLAKMTQIQNLELDSQSQYDNVLTSMTNLTHLRVFNFEENDVPPPNVTSLTVFQINNYPKLMKLEALELTGYCFEDRFDFKKISSLASLRSLTYRDFSIFHIPYLTNLTKLAILDRRATSLMNLNWIQHFTLLTRLQVFEYSCKPRVCPYMVASLFPLRDVVIRFLPNLA